MLRVFVEVVRRDLLLAMRRRGDVFSHLSFFVLVCSLFPFAVGTAPRLLADMGPGVVWVAALLAATLSLGRLFAFDHADGTLEQMLLSPEPLVVIVAAKICAHWLLTGLPLLLLCPLMALQFGMSGAVLAALAASLLVGTPVLSVIGAIGAALTLGVRGGGVLVALLVLPLYVPVLIFGAGATANGADAAGANLLLLGGLLAAALALAPWAVALALRISAE
jgi:heme exporter protein B